MSPVLRCSSTGSAPRFCALSEPAVRGTAATGELDAREVAVGLTGDVTLEAANDWGFAVRSSEALFLGGC